jgi:hypothetical protein
VVLALGSIGKFDSYRCECSGVPDDFIDVYGDRPSVVRMMKQTVRTKYRDVVPVTLKDRVRFACGFITHRTLPWHSDTGRC